MKFFIILSIFAAVFTQKAVAQKCAGTNQVYSLCGNNHCQNTCKWPYQALYCRPSCIPGCICEDGYVKDKAGNCVPREKCHIECSDTEVYSECGANFCQNTCEWPDMTSTCRPPCIRGCICRDGFIRDENGKCIRREECPNKCLDTEVYSECGANTCQNTCKWPDLASTCRPTCIPGCICREGYIRDDAGNCIPKEKCPIKCLDPEVYSECGAKKCENTCERPNLGLTCNGTCIPGCICKEGYLRDEAGNCVLASCCVKCRDNEVYSQCGADCQSTCEKPAFCCTTTCTAGCICKRGYIRNSEGECIPEFRCPKEVIFM